MRRAVGLAACAIASLVGARAGATAQPQFWGAESQSRHSPKIVVADEHVEVTCDARGPWLECTGTSRLVLENPTDRATSIELEVDDHATALLVDGASLALPPATAAGLVRVPDAVGFAPKQRRVVETRYGTFRFRGDAAAGDYGLRFALPTRHPTLGAFPGPPTAIDLSIAGVDSKRFASFVLRTITLHLPSSFRVDATNGADQGVVDDVRTLAFVAVDPSAGLELHARLGYQTPTWLEGGPVFGLGYGIESSCAECASATRVKFGWELGLGRFFLLGLAGEIDGAHREVAAITIDGATPTTPFVSALPSFSLGLGVPMRIARTPQLGLRAQAGATWRLGPVSLGAALVADWFPSWRSLAPMLQIGL